MDFKLFSEFLIVLNEKSLERLGLGTVQWGMEYGVSASKLMPSAAEVTQILSEARIRGIKYIDTAPVYGSSESVLGFNDLSSFNVITKTIKLNNHHMSNEDVKFIVNNVLKSLNRLSSESVYGLLIHNSQDLFSRGGENLINQILKLKKDGLVQKIGVSLYDETELDEVLKIFLPDLVQVPLNIFDQRMLLSGALERLKLKGIEIHLRSIFLQGLLLMSPEKIPSYFNPILPLMKKLSNQLSSQNLSPIQAAISFAKSIQFADVILIGIENFQQLNECCDAFLNNIEFDATNFSIEDNEFINPSMWRLNA